MLKHYINLGIRYLWKQRLFTAINLLGLTLGFSCAVVITIWIDNQLNFDRFHANADRIYRSTIEVDPKNGYAAHFARCWQSWIDLLPEYFPEIEKQVRLVPLRHTAVKFRESKFYAEQAFRCGSEIFDVFTFDMVRGNPDRALKKSKGGPAIRALGRNLLRIR